MIRLIDIRLNAAHPELPLAEAVTFTGAPSTVLIRGVPPNCGRWAITAVFVAATYPDGSTTTRAAVQSANGVWVATLPATARSGRTENGLRVMVDGIDENGAAVTGYILGVADFAVASLGVTPAPEPGETSWQMLYFDAVPGTLRKGDVTKVDGVLKLYNGTAWEAFAGDIPAPSTATPAMDGTGSAGTSAAYARGDHVHPTDTSRMAASATGADIAVSGSDATKIDTALAGKATKADATLEAANYEYGAWVAVASDGHDYAVVYDEFGGNWYLDCDSGMGPLANEEYSPTATEITFGPYPMHGGEYELTATATRTATPTSYRLGPDDSSNPNRDKPLASEAEAEALRTGKQDALTAQQLANIAAVSDALAFDATHSYAPGDPVVYNGTLYTFTSTHTGAWTGSDVSAVDIIARLAGKLSITNTAPQFQDEDTIYKPGSLVVYNGSLYVCTQQHYGPWNADHFSAQDVVDSAISRRVDSKVDKPTVYTTNNLASIDEFGNIADSGIAKANVAQKSDIPYDLGAPTVIDTASSETVEGETVTYGAATLINRTANIVQVTASTALDELRITFPA
ncbi:MAG: hypothetical protein IIZ06_01625, partial [Kiritimatiellae bacterium]|nr:hypothetical protein [Kiritimatiellia bacterium]